MYGLIQSGRAEYRLDWSGPGRLVDHAGADLEPWPLVEAAVSSPDGVPALEAWLAAHDAPLDYRAAPSRRGARPTVAAGNR